MSVDCLPGSIHLSPATETNAISQVACTESLHVKQLMNLFLHYQLTIYLSITLFLYFNRHSFHIFIFSYMTVHGSSHQKTIKASIS